MAITLIELSITKGGEAAGKSIGFSNYKTADYFK